MAGRSISKVEGTAIPVRGNDIDTDRIIPARFLKCVTFESLGPESFRDDRFDQNGNSKNHPFDDARFTGASILFVNSNFGCGSSREHAPQAIHRWGINGLVGESFAEIFYGNCVALGIPCLVLGKDDLLKAMELIEAKPKVQTEINVELSQVKVGDTVFAAQIADGPQGQFLKGTWDATSQLMEDEDAVATVASDLPYTNW